MTTVSYQFWNVGQGLFSSGKIEPQDGKTFCWVYDCGSISSYKNVLIPAIQTMRNQYQGDIDLLTISHFDNDHINGLDQLLQHKSVNYFMLPYYPLWQRLLLICALKITQENPLFEYYINPVSYIEKHYGDKVKTILLLPTAKKNNISDALAFEDEMLSFEYLPLPEEFNTENSDKVKLLNPKKAIEIEGIEFFPFNTFIRLPKKLNLVQFKIDVEHILISNKVIKNALSPQTISKVISTLKQSYDQHFKTSNRNKSSLFLYISPINDHLINKQCQIMSNNFSTNICSNKNALLYTGDGFLDTNPTFDELEKELEKSRMARICSFQVPHHGSVYSWNKKGLAQKIQPELSIFCAGPHGGYNHPHPDVVSDFSPYRPILVDKFNALNITYTF